MYDSKLQKADGCSVFVSLLLTIILLSSFFIFQKLFEPESPPPTDQITQEERSVTVSKYKEEERIFQMTIDNYHSERNSSLSNVMSKVVKSYQAK